MADPFLGEIRMISWNYAPKNWAFCNGQTLAISTNQALFALLGTTYGGDGVRTYQLPNLQGRVPLGFGAGPNGNAVIGQKSGSASVTLTQQQVPPHTHLLNVQKTAGVNDVNGSGEWLSSMPKVFAPPASPANLTNLEPTTTILPAGGNQPHENRQPYLCINFAIALSGIFPSRN